MTTLVLEEGVLKGSLKTWGLLYIILIYFIKLSLCVCVSICPFVLYTNPQFQANRRGTWYEASLWHWAEQGQVGDAHNVPQGEQHVVACREPVLVYSLKRGINSVVYVDREKKCVEFGFMRGGSLKRGLFENNSTMV